MTLSEQIARPSVVQILREASSVALVGASDNLVRPGGRLVTAMKRYGFEGAIYPVNPGREQIQDLQSYRSVSEIGAPVDVAVVVVGAQDVAAAVTECVDADVQLIIIGSAGFSETGDAGRADEAVLLRLIEGTNTRILGPNTNGALSVSNGLVATFSPALQQDGFRMRDGTTAIVSQSGALGAAMFALAQNDGMDVGLMINTGNEADIGFEEVLGLLAGVDSDTSAVLGYMEGLTDVDALVQAAADAYRSDTTLAMLKVGRTVRGAAAVAAHTAKLAGSDRVFDGVFRQLGILRTDTLSALVDVGRCAESLRGFTGQRMTVASLSGGLGVIVADAVEQFGLELATWSEPWQAELDAWLPTYLGRKNPIDLGGGPFSDLQALSSIVKVLDANPDSDLSVLAIANFEARQDGITDTLIATKSELSKPLVVVWYGEAGRSRRRLNGAGIPSFFEPTDCVRALAGVIRRSPGSIITEMVPAIDVARQEQALTLLAGRPPGQLEPIVTDQLLALYGVPAVAQVVATLDEGYRAHTVSFPAYLKLASRELSHKSDVGGVSKVTDDQELSAGIVRMRDVALELGLRDAQLVAQQAIEPGSELLLGMSRDPAFGSVVTLGLGGVLAEALDDVVVRLPVLDETDVVRMLGELRHPALLSGFRHLPPVQARVVAPVVVSFAALVREIGDHFDAIDLNPLIVGASGRITAVDALFLVSTAEHI